MGFRIKRFGIRLYNKLFRNGFRSVFYDRRLIDCSGHDRPFTTAIGDHICTLFSDIVLSKPKFIVELGTRGGQSTQACLAAASYCGARVLSIDINPCDGIDVPEAYRDAWEFECADDIAFARDRFAAWCQTRGIEGGIDLLFIDTSHEYEHTVKEIEAWFPFLSERGMVVFHDTNMRPVYRRLDNSVGTTCDNQRGVMRAVEEYLGKQFDETKVFVDVVKGWLVRHHPYSSGLTLLRRMDPAAVGAGEAA